MEKLKCLILNISPFGPQDEKGIGKNSIFQYIPLDKSKMTCKEKSLGYYVSFNCIYDTSETSLFNKVKEEELILVPVEIEYSGKFRHAVITSIKKL